MLASTPRSVKNLSLSEKERDHHSRNRLGWHVFVSRYFSDFKDAPPEIKSSLVNSLDALRHQPVDAGMYDDSEDSACNHNVVIKSDPHVKLGDTMKLASAHWRSTSDGMKESWRKRAEYLNSRPIPGKYVAIPYSLKSNFVNTVLESLTGEWKSICKVFGAGMKRPKKVVQAHVKGSRKCFGKERVMVRNEVVRTICTSALMVVALFGEGGKCFEGGEIVETTRNTTVVHIASLRRMAEIFTINSLCASNCEWKGLCYSYGSKVSIERNGREAIGYVMEEDDDSWFVAVRIETERICVPKVRYNSQDMQYYFPYVPCGKYKVKQYWPIRLMIRKQKFVYIANVLVTNRDDGLFKASICT